MGDTVSAVPSVLTGWAAWAQAQNPTLANAARRADEAIQAFNSSKPDPAVVTHPVPYPGENVVSYATRNGVVDRWVGKVGEAFFAIATKDLPPQAVGYESSYYSNKRISASEKDLEQQVGGDPIAQARAAGDAAKMHEAIDRGDGGTVRRMANGLAPYVQKGDGAYLAAYYRELGPDYTVKATHYMRDFRDPAQAAALKTFDQGLVTATNQPGWDPSFDDKVFAEGTEDHPADPHRFLLLAYANAPHAASFSQHFLERAGDARFFPGANAQNLPHVPVSNQESATWVLHAISLNHKAAADWLLGHPPGQQDPGTTRFHALRGNSDLIALFQTGRNPQAVSDLIAAAGDPATGRSKDVFNLFLRYEPGEVPDVLRPGIARAVGENIPTLLHAPKDVQERLLKIATKNGDGAANGGAALAFATEAGRYLGTLVNSNDLHHSKNLYEVWEQSSAVLTLLHDNLHEIDDDAAKSKAIRDALVWGAVDLAPVPGLSGGVKSAAEFAKSVLLNAKGLYDDTHEEPPDPRTQINIGVAKLIAAQYVRQHPDLVAPGQDPRDVALGLASGRVEKVPGHEQLTGLQEDEMYDFLQFVHGVRSRKGE